MNLSFQPNRVQETQLAIESVHAMCRQDALGKDLVSAVALSKPLIRFRPVAVGALHWLGTRLTRSDALDANLTADAYLELLRQV